MYKRQGADAEVVLAYLFKKTNLQINYHFNMVTIARNTPAVSYTHLTLPTSDLV